jgi:hypothetical protein
VDRTISALVSASGHFRQIVDVLALLRYSKFWVIQTVVPYHYQRDPSPNVTVFFANRAKAAML